MRTIALTAVLAAWPLAPSAASFTIDPESSVFAIATERGGVAGRMAHDHLVHAGQYDYELTTDENDPSGTAFSLVIKAEDLVIDEADALDRWWPKLKERGLVPREASSFSDRERADVREAMLGEDQLDAGNYPEIRAELVSLTPNGDADGAYTARVAMTVVGETVEYDFDATLSLEGETLEVEAAAVAKFTDFGIRPYRAFLGAVRNKDEFTVFVRFRATRG